MTFSGGKLLYFPTNPIRGRPEKFRFPLVIQHGFEGSPEGFENHTALDFGPGKPFAGFCSIFKAYYRTSPPR
jgi:hypothetical protein